MAEKKKNTLVSFLGWCFGFESPKKQLSQREQPDLQISRPEPQTPDWRQGEIDENGTRFWMIDYPGQGFIKHVEYVPGWYRSSNPPFGTAKVHPRCLNIDGTMPCFGDHHLIFGQFIYPELPPPGLFNPPPQLNQLYARQITESETPARLTIQR